MPNPVRAIMDRAISSARNAVPVSNGRFDWRQAADLVTPGNWWDSQRQHVDPYGVADGVGHLAGSPVPVGTLARAAAGATGTVSRGVQAILGRLNGAPTPPEGGWQPRISPTTDYSGRTLASRFRPSANLAQVNVIPHGEGEASAREEIARGQRETIEASGPQRSQRRDAGGRGLSNNQQAQFEGARIEQSMLRGQRQAQEYMNRGLER